MVTRCADKRHPFYLGHAPCLLDDLTLPFALTFTLSHTPLQAHVNNQANGGNGARGGNDVSGGPASHSSGSHGGSTGSTSGSASGPSSAGGHGRGLAGETVKAMNYQHEEDCEPEESYSHHQGHTVSRPGNAVGGSS